MAHTGQRFGGLDPTAGEAIPQAVRDAGLEVVRVRADSDDKRVDVYVESGEQAERDAARLAAQAVAPDDWTVKVMLWS
jgi:hypothetical protein